MDSRFNIPAPPTFKLRGRVGGEGPGDERPGPRKRDVAASAKADPLNPAPRKI